MFNILMFDNQEISNKKQLIIIEEKIKLNELLLSKRDSRYANHTEYFPLNKLARNYIHRNLVDDTYNIEIATYNAKIILKILMSHIY